MKRVIALVLTLAILPLVLTGCGDKATSDGASSEEAAPSATSGSGAESTSETYTTTDGDLDVDAISKELDAIQQELDETALPDDSDFSEIEDGL